jgi:hypothetical protein
VPRLLAAAACVLAAASSCKLIGSKPPPGFACERDGSCASGLTCCVDGFCRASCDAAGGGTAMGGVGGGTAGAGGGGNSCTPNVPCSGNPGAPCHVGRAQCSGSTASCVDAEAALDGTPCTGGVCSNGACAPCTPDSPCGTNVDRCTPGVLSCTPDGGAICVDSAGLRDAGATCGVDQVCTVDGACVACAQGAVCTTNPSACLAGKTDCAGGVVRCNDTSMKLAAGAGCGQNDVCDGDGGCVACTQSGPCASNPDPCKNGTLDCKSGSAVCRDGAPKSPGAVCSLNKVCSPTGTCIDCTEAASCATNPTACKLGVTSCLGGNPACVDTMTNRTAGASCGMNNVCDGDGGCLSCSPGAPCTGNPNVCKQGVTSCSTGRPVCMDGTQNASNGTQCAMGKTCNSGICGTCAGNSTCTGNPTPCKVGTQNCMGAMPTCDDSAQNVGPGVSCGPNQVCNGSGSCVSCTQGAACTGNPNPCKQGVVDCSTGAPTCTDGSDQALGTVCSAGFCSGGSCITCALGMPCSGNPTACDTGITARAGSTCVCSDGQVRPVGQVTGCTGNSTCNGSGGCVSCNGGCQPTNECQTGTVSCTDLSCVANGTKADLTTCTNGVCRGGSCCTGCWNGTACLAGTSKTACGMNGDACASCPGVCKPGISGTSCFAQVCETCL